MQQALSFLAVPFTSQCHTPDRTVLGDPTLTPDLDSKPDP